MVLCWAYRMAGQYDKALEQAKKAVELDRKQAERAYLPQVALAGAYMMASHEAEGRAAAEEVLRINPKFSLDQYARTLPLKIGPRLTSRLPPFDGRGLDRRWKKEEGRGKKQLISLPDRVGLPGSFLWFNSEPGLENSGCTSGPGRGLPSSVS